MTKPWPEEIRVKRAERRLEIAFDTGERFILPAEFLRVLSPSAEVQGHGTEKPPPLGGKSNVGLTNAEPVGNYAVRLHFDDGHSTGLYSWDLLYRMGKELDALWAEYLKRLEGEGLTREP